MTFNRYRSSDRMQVVLLVLLVGVLTPLIASDPVALDTSVTIATISIISISFAISYGLGGMLSFAQATFAALGAYTSAILTTRLGLPPLAGLLLAIVVPLGVAYVLARVIVRLSPLALGLATLALSQLIELALDEGGAFTGGYVGISGIATFVDGSQWIWLHGAGWALVALMLMLYVRLRNSNRGRANQIVSTDGALAQGLGIRPAYELSLLFTLSGGIAGLAGWFYAHTRSYLAPTSLSLDLSFMIAIAVIIGGRRTLLGPVLGTAVIVILKDALPGTETHGMFYGAGLIITLLLFPEGILGIDWKSIMRRKDGNPSSLTVTREARVE